MGGTTAEQQPGKTKYGRIPLWLYDAGVSLQAVAAYGWLHGRYGHFDRITPSYATLAKELKVSRGSAIAYVKELTAVGAVRITVSGAVGQTTNSYDIAFDQPFTVQDVPLSTGQNADQGVSGLYQGGQNADPGGQPTVQEEDVFLQTKKTLSPQPPQQPAEEPPATDNGERETIADATKTADRLTAAQKAVRGSVPTDDEPAFIAWITAKYTPDGPGWWRAVARNGDFAELADTWRADQAPAAKTRASPGLPDWCTECGDGFQEQAETNARFRYLNGQPCQACHPDHCKEPAA